MNKIIAYAKLCFRIELPEMQEEVIRQLSKEVPHFNNTHYTGEWTAIALRSPGGEAKNIVPDAMGVEAFDDTALMQECATIKTFIHSFRCSVMSVRLLNLKKGAIIKEHRDAELSFEKGEARIHIPLLTNRDVAFSVEGKQVFMHEGECWYINANLPHSVSNSGETDRIHLVIDCKVNEWLQKVFAFAEKTYSKGEDRTDQKRMMIRELRLQDTTTAHQLANQLEEQLNAESVVIEQSIFPSWLPYKIVPEKNGILLQWLYVNKQAFTDPFFDETIAKCKTLSENSTGFKSVSDLSIINEWAGVIESVEPTAFIFHVSRCGSTLISQLLAMKGEHISLSEVPVFDEILQMPLKNQASEAVANEALAAAIKLYGGKRTGKENRLFIKTDSWHLLFYGRLRALYPLTPFVVIYRNPEEVLFSQQRKKGIHAVQDMIAPGLFSFSENEVNQFNAENYIAFVLEKYLAAITEIARIDKKVLLVNYNEDIINIMQKIAGFTNTRITATDNEMFSERSRYHSKDSKELFAEKYALTPITAPNLSSLIKLYEQIEELRCLM